MTTARVATLHELVRQIEGLVISPRPVMLAVAGAPGSGKSTLAATLQQRIKRKTCVIPMDGFHLDNSVLKRQGLLARKGAPETFDAAGFQLLAASLRAGTTQAFPTFDRVADRVVPDGGAVSHDVEILIFEGNYLLLDEPIWRDLQTLWDASVWLDVPKRILEARLVQRWLDHGLDADAARTRANQNDMANANRVIDNRLQPTWELTAQTMAT